MAHLPNLSAFKAVLRSFASPARGIARRESWRGSNLAWLLFSLVVLVAAFFRLASLNLAEFKGDEAGTSFVLAALIRHGQVPLVGPPLTTGGKAGPVFYYILAFPFLISSDPVVASAFVAILNVVGIAFTYKFAREFFSERVALIATALAAVSPFAILFSRKIWNPDLVFPFTVILLYCLYSFVIKRKPKYLVPIFALYAVILQIHPITLFLAPVILLFLCKFRSGIQLKYLTIGVGLFLLLFSPFIYGQAVNNFGEAGRFASALGDFQFNHVNLNVIGLLSADTSGTGFDYILGSSMPAFASSIGNANNYFVVENICLYLGFALVLLRSTTKPFGENAKYSILLAWMTIPTLILLFFDPTFGLYTHYLVMFYPANFLMVALLFDYAMTSNRGAGLATIPSPRWRKPVRVAATIILLSILLAQVTFGIGFLAFLNSHGGTAGDYGVGVQYKMEVASYIAHNSNGSAFTISSDLSPGHIGVEYDYLLSLYNKAPASSASLNYVIVDSLTGIDPTLMQQISADPRMNFGPLTVYTVQR